MLEASRAEDNDSLRVQSRLLQAEASPLLHSVEVVCVCSPHEIKHKVHVLAVKLKLIRVHPPDDGFRHIISVSSRHFKATVHK